MKWQRQDSTFCLSGHKVHALFSELQCNFLVAYNQMPYQMETKKVFTTLVNETFK